MKRKQADGDISMTYISFLFHNYCRICHQISLKTLFSIHPVPEIPKTETTCSGMSSHAKIADTLPVPANIKAFRVIGYDLLIFN